MTAQEAKKQSESVNEEKYKFEYNDKLEVLIDSVEKQIETACQNGHYSVFYHNLYFRETTDYEYGMIDYLVENGFQINKDGTKNGFLISWD